MSELIIEFLKAINVFQLAAIAIMFWFFYKRLDSKIDKLDQRLSDRIDKLDQRLSEEINKFDQRLSDRIDKLSERIDRLSQRVDDIDKRLCRIEGSLSSQGHCLFTKSQSDKVV